MTEAEFAAYIDEAYEWAVGGKHPGSVQQWRMFVGAVAQQARLEGPVTA